MTDVVEISSLLNEHARLPCNVSTGDVLANRPQAILWYRNELATGPPFLTVDLRDFHWTGNESQTQLHPHPDHVSERYKKRVQLDFTARLPTLVLRPVLAEDQGIYLCR